MLRSLYVYYVVKLMRESIESNLGLASVVGHLNITSEIVLEGVSTVQNHCQSLRPPYRRIGNRGLEVLLILTGMNRVIQPLDQRDEHQQEPIQSELKKKLQCLMLLLVLSLFMILLLLL